mmetsp:Transcript_139600/g.446700  ORF Transcript_139600/g.446700 Transcript_139600/m.446700 type:complete len:120 (-) Transcript_139600:132-491(-)
MVRRIRRNCMLTCGGLHGSTTCCTNIAEQPQGPTLRTLALQSVAHIEHPSVLNCILRLTTMLTTSSRLFCRRVADNHFANEWPRGRRNNPNVAENRTTGRWTMLLAHMSMCAECLVVGT